MIREPDSRRSQTEHFPNNFKPVETPESVRAIYQRIRSIVEIDTGIPSELSPNETRKKRYYVVEGFEDVLHTPLGGGPGDWYNMQANIYELTLSLALSQHPAVNDILAWKGIAKDAVKHLREHQVLSGLRIIDLGCGKLPSFALAAHTLGASVYTADADDLNRNYKTQLDGHVIVDFNQPDAASIIQRVTGSNFDLVTEHIITPVSSSYAHVEKPKPATIVSIAGNLLKQGGYLYYTPDIHSAEGMQLLRKID